MENRRILNPRRWSLIRTGQTLGALGGALYTLVAQGLALLTLRWPAGGVSEAVAYFFALLWLAAITPTALVYRLLNYEWRVGRATDITLSTLCVMVVVNAILVGVLGAGFGYGLHMIRKRKNTNQN